VIVAEARGAYNLKLPFPATLREMPVLAEPNRTPYDLNFRLFGFRVRVHPLFWLGAVLLGASILNHRDGNGLLYLLIWVVVVFVSILVHELGHAFAFRRFGSDSHIVLWVFGGLAVPYSAVAGRWRRIVVYLAGPIAGFILCGIVYFSNRLTDWALAGGTAVLMLYVFLFAVNLFWGIMNLLPVFPLDGGQVSRELCEAKWRNRGLAVALKISIVTAAAVAIYSLVCEIERRSGEAKLTGFLPWWVPRGDVFTAILFGLLAAQSYMLLQQLRGSGGYYYEGPDDRVPWER
jgi:Zn-dependent protease